ncbi:MAG TPA: TonB-dependent receptor [Geobacteraceae bacterium]
MALLTLVWLASMATAVWAGTDEEQETLEMFYEAKDLVATASRSPKPVSQTAENITVVTAEEIKAINAHTLADVLAFVPGLQVDKIGGPGNIANVYILGSKFGHVLVLIDGVQQNALAENFTDYGAIPVQQIERIEIVKGPASSSWGSALGGVINIVTKSPEEGRTVGGLLSASLGDRLTGDYRGEFSGTTGPFGYYLSAGHLTSSGLVPNNGLHATNLYTKLHQNLTGGGDLTFTLGYTKESRGDGESSLFDFGGSDRQWNLFTTVGLHYPLSGRSDLDLSLRGSRRYAEVVARQLSTGELFPGNPVTTDETLFGGSMKSVWRGERQTLVAGADLDHGDDEITTSDTTKRNQDKVGLFVNDTVTIGPLAVTPGIRYDHASTDGDFWSPSFGVTYSLTEQTVLRAYAAKGYSLHNLVPDMGQLADGTIVTSNRAQEVWTAQTGIETADVPGLHLKTTLFMNETWNIFNAADPASRGRERRQGVEVEMRTAPLFHTSLSGGFVFIEGRDRHSGAVLTDVPRYTYDVGLHHDSPWVKATLLGHYIDWDSAAAVEVKSKTFIWDLHATKQVVRHENFSLELFFSLHNIFNGRQYLEGSLTKNPRRWAEGGLRLVF